jgi:predicted membrane channel-forming protein YqfA (hemolysin III family)
MTGTSGIEGRLRISGVLIVLGLLVEALSLIRIHPLAFLSFMFIGGALLIAGIIVYLTSIAAASSPSGD